MMKFTPAILYSCIFVVDGGYSPVDHWMSARNDNFLKALIHSFYHTELISNMFLFSG